MTNRGGLMGMLGGLALGGLLGSMFFGGAFENFNFMDILIFGGVAFLLYKLFAARARNTQPNAYNRTTNDLGGSQVNQTETAGFNTDVLFKKDHQFTTGSSTQESTSLNNTSVIPASINYEKIIDRDGKELTAASISGAPIYLLGESTAIR